MPLHQNERGGGGRCKAKLRSSKGLIQNKLSQNSFQSMSVSFLILFTWHHIKNIDIFPYCLSIATKEVGVKEVRLSHGAQKA